MTTIHDIMQVGVGMPDRERFENFARDMLGFPARRSPDGNVTYVRPDQYRHRIAARTAAEPILRYLGFDVGGPQGLAEWETKLTAEGIDWRRGTPEECVERQVTDFIELEDPDGHHLALSYGFEVDKEPVHYTRDLSVLRLGHVLLTVNDTQRTHDFYTAVLGFRLSDWVCIDNNIRLCFLRCNARHHSMAFAPSMPGKSPRLQHVMLEVESLDDVMRSYHFLRIHKAPIGMGPG
ncbi:MAG TPA: VOC family protein, partial [Candidatus Binatia bacterium]|nr:VOC family protein [Candidatus Binatia bacterium]